MQCLNSLIGSESNGDGDEIVTGLISLAAQVAFEVCYASCPGRRRGMTEDLLGGG